MKRRRQLASLSSCTGACGDLLARQLFRRRLEKYRLVLQLHDLLDLPLPTAEPRPEAFHGLSYLQPLQPRLLPEATEGLLRVRASRQAVSSMSPFTRAHGW